MKQRLLILFVLSAAASACGGSGGGSPAGGADAGAGEERDEWDDRLDEREVDYNAALRIAALRLTGELPSLAEIDAVAQAGGLSAQAEVYRSLVAGYLENPLFTRQMVQLWRDVFKAGGTPELDSAAAFAAELVIEDRPYTELFTATSGTCPTFDPGPNAIAAADCQNGVPVHAGVLSNPGVMAHFYSNLAFRRTRWVQETFDCTAYPVEVGEPQDVGGAAAYNGVWPFDSIGSPATGGSIDFLDVKSVVCANCHQTLNHRAPLFAQFDAAGMWQGTIAVPLPTDGAPLARMEDWLPAGETTAWRYGIPAADLPSLGAAMAADPHVAECAVARTWNWALGKGDVVDTLTIVPSDVIAAQVAAFTGGGFKMKALLLDVFTSDDFVRF
ncbi:MAG TPA: hypothetical protein VIG06_30140 [Kofleriaceae bacterium]